MTRAIAGTGAIAAVGRGTDEVFAALCAGRSGLAPLHGFDPAAYRAPHAYEIDDRPAPRADRPGRATELLLAAIEEAVHDAGIGEDLREIPVLVGTGLRELRSAELAWRERSRLDPGQLHFGTALRERFGADTTYTFSNACSASLSAVALADDLLAAGAADTVVVAGTDVLTESMFGLLDRVQAGSPDQVRPFDRSRRGTLLGEGAAAVVLRAEPVGGYSRPARGRLLAAAVNCDAHHVTAPDPQGMAAAMRDAHQRAGIAPGDIDLILLHGTGTLLNDEAEAAAVCEVFGADRDRPLMTAIKSMTGHTSGGSGLLGLVVAVEAMAEVRVPPTVGLTDPLDAAAGFRLVRGEYQAASARIAQVNAFGFGGVNAVAVLAGVGADG